MGQTKTAAVAITNANVRGVIAARRISQQQVAAWLGLSPSAISLRLSGRSDWRLRELEVLAEHLDISFEWLVTDHGYGNRMTP